MTSPRQQGFGGAFGLCSVLLCLPFAAVALDLDFPGTATLALSVPPLAGQHPIATGPWQSGSVPIQTVEGIVQDLTWQVTGTELTSLSLLNILRDQIEAEGFTTTFTCFSNGCGGFDFRHALPLGQAPEMYVDLGNFHYLTASRDGPEGPEALALTVSLGGTTGFVHLALVQPATETAPPVVQSSRTPDQVRAADPAPREAPITPQGGDLIDLLAIRGSAPLTDLLFETGASQLSGNSYATLTSLAAFLAADTTRQVVLVGHTDATGSLAGNIALSEARATAVRSFLISELSVDPAQVEARGIGFLAPRAPNTTPQGREANRRVEVVLANPG